MDGKKPVQRLFLIVAIFAFFHVGAPSPSFGQEINLEELTLLLEAAETIEQAGEILAGIPSEVRDAIPAKHFYKFVFPEPFDDLVNLFLTQLLYFFPPEGAPSVLAATKQFQQDLGHPETGEITIGEFSELSDRASAIGQQHIVVGGPRGRWNGSFWVGLEHQGVLNAEGTWVSPGGALAWPVNITSIRCDRVQGVCTETIAFVNLPAPAKPGDGALVLEMNFFDVLSWTENEVIAKSNFFDECRIRALLTINKGRGEVTMAVTPASNGSGCWLVDMFPDLEAQIIVSLTDGRDATKQLRTSRSDATADLFALRARELLGRFLGQKQ